MAKKTSVSLVLGSGGARGLAHIGIIHWLEANNFAIKSIAGCSIGSLIGGVYAAGKLSEFEQWVRAINKTDIVSLLDLSWSSSGFVKGDKIIETLKDLVGEVKIEDLPIPYTAVAADIKKEKEVWMNSGGLFEAIRASISLPFLFTPVNRAGAMLIDGGVLNPVPIAPTFGDGNDITIAVNLGGPDAPIPEQKQQLPGAGNNKASFHESIQEFIDKLSMPKSFTPDWDMFDIANETFDAMQNAIARQKLAAYPPDYTINIARNACGTLDFDLADEMIQLGFDKAQAAFEKG